VLLFYTVFEPKRINATNEQVCKQDEMGEENDERMKFGFVFL
jgi:hypothetical protein